MCLSLYRKKELEYMQKPIKLRNSGHVWERVTLFIELLRLSSVFPTQTPMHTHYNTLLLIDSRSLLHLGWAYQPCPLF